MPLNMKFVFFFTKDSAWETPFYLPHYSEKILLLADLKMFTTIYFGVPINFLWSIFCNLIHSDLRCQRLVPKFNTQVTGLFRSLTCVWAAVIVLDLTLISESVCVCGSEWGRRNVRERVVEWVSLCVWGLSAVRTVSVDEILTCTCDFSVCGSSSLEWLLLYTLSYHYMCQH